MLHYLTLTLNAAFLHILLHYVWLHLVDSMSTRWRTKEKGQQPFSHDIVVLVSKRADDGELWIRDHHVVGGGTEHHNGVSRRRVEETKTESQRGFLQGWTDESEHCACEYEWGRRARRAEASPQSSQKSEAYEGHREWSVRSIVTRRNARHTRRHTKFW